MGHQESIAQKNGDTTNYTARPLFHNSFCISLALFASSIVKRRSLKITKCKKEPITEGPRNLGYLRGLFLAVPGRYNPGLGGKSVLL